MGINSHLKLHNLVSFIYMLSNVKKMNFTSSLALLTPINKHKIKNLKGLKKKLVLKLVILQLEKVVFKVINFKTRISIKNVFTLFDVKRKLKVPDNAVI
jgi:hypothetical protein